MILSPPKRRVLCSVQVPTFHLSPTAVQRGTQTKSKRERQAKQFQQPGGIMWRFGLICGLNIGSASDVLTAILYSGIESVGYVYFQKKFVSVTENPKPIVTGCLKYSHFRDIITKRVFCEQGGLYGCNI